MPDGAHLDVPTIAPTDNFDVAVGKFNKFMADAAAHVKTANERGEKVPQLEKMVGDLTAEFRALRETAAVGGGGASTPNDAELRMFTDGERVRWVGGEDRQGIYRSGLLDDDAPVHGEWHKELRHLVQQRTLVRIACKPASSERRFGDSPKTDALLVEHLKKAPAPLKKAAEEVVRTFSGASGAGGDWVPTLILPELATEARMPLQVEAQFDTFDMGSKTVNIPFDSGVAKPYRKGIPGSNPANYTAAPTSTTSRAMTADSLAVMIPLFDDADEDSVIATQTLLARKVQDGLRYGWEDCLINGDTAATHEDTGLASWNPRSIYTSGTTFGGSDDHRRSFIGLRAAAFDASATRDGSGDTAAFTAATGRLTAMRALMDAPHGVAGDLIYLTSLEEYLLVILADTNVLTAQNFGNKATLLTGQVVDVSGVRIVPTEFLTPDLNASGIFDNVTKTKTASLLVNRKRWVIGNRRGTMLEADKNIINGITYFVATRRGTFKSLDGSTHKNVTCSYKIATS